MKRSLNFWRRNLLVVYDFLTLRFMFDKVVSEVMVTYEERHFLYSWDLLQILHPRRPP